MAKPDEPSTPETPADGRGPLGPEHWSRARSDMNQEALDYYRERSQAPGVAEGGGPRNHYCLECNGVLPLSYEQRRPAEAKDERCPHCGAALEGRVRAMFNWVETDQVPPSDAAALLRPLLLVGVGLAVLAGALWVWVR